MKYVIDQGRMFSSYAPAWAWRSYSGSNQHIQHTHVSVVADARGDDGSPWGWSTTRTTPTTRTEPDDLEGEHMGPGDKGKKVRHWQRRMIALGYARRTDGSTVTDGRDKWADGDYGAATTAATKRLQDTVGYKPTGEVDADLRDRMVEAFTDVRDTNRRQALAARLTAKIGAATGMPEAKIRQLIANEADEAARDAVSAALKDEYAVTIQRRALP